LITIGADFQPAATCLPLGEKWFHGNAKMGSGDPISSFHRPHGRGDSPGKGNIDFDIMGVT